MNYWLMKPEPTTYGIEVLAKRPNKQDDWEGVRNYQARNFMRDNMRLHDQAFFYHSNCEVPGIAGIMKISRESHPDLSALDLNSEYYDPKSTPNDPRWFMVSVQLVEKFDRIIPLQLLKTIKALKDFALIKPGNRLSVMPVSAAEWKIILSLK